MGQAILEISHHHKSESSNEALTKAEASKGVGLFSRKRWSSERLKVSRTFSILESLSLKASRLSMILFCFFLLEDFWKMSDVSNCSGAQQRSERCRFQGFPILRNECIQLMLSDIFCNWDCLKLWWIPFLVWKGTFRYFHRFPQAKEMLRNCNKQVNAKASERCVHDFFYFCIYMRYFLAVALGKRHDIATIHVIKIVNSPGSISLLVSLSLGRQWLRKFLT